jgi:C4-type Zn-finger protein
MCKNKSLFAKADFVENNALLPYEGNIFITEVNCLRCFFV